MNIILGSTGVVGSSLCEQIKFEHKFNRSNFNNLNDSDYNNSTLYLSCLPATKWLVNKNLKEDLENIWKIIKGIEHLKFDRVILISTIDVYCNSEIGIDEDGVIKVDKLSYGTNRYLFELMTSDLLRYEDLKIFRLPAIFNKNIKKNILFDLINNNEVNQINLNSSFQWYNLDNLSMDIDNLINKYPNKKSFNLFTEPIETTEILKFFPQYKDVEFKKNQRIEYNFKTKYATTGYLNNKTQTLLEIEKFIYEVSNK
jgi:nucleoside-diphosphate-sugar epimerase